MASKYLPPHLRNRKDTAKVSPILEEVKSIEEKFPALSNTNTVRVTEQKPGKSFASLATDWANESERQKEEDDNQRYYRQTMNDVHKQSSIPLPKFHNVRHFVEPEDDEKETTPAMVNNDETGWIEVRRKKKDRRPKTFEEKLAEDELKEQEPKEETVWNTEDDESYWKH